MSSEQPRTPLLLGVYQRYLDDQDSAAFVSKVAKYYTASTLERLAAHPSREVRRAAVFGLGLMGGCEANQSLGRAMVDDDRTVRMLAQNGIRSLWLRAGSEQERRQLNIVIRLNAAQHYQDAVRRASDLIAQAPALAEAWNQRAVAHFALRHNSESIRDCHQALELNPYHFPAAATMGQAYLELGNRLSALESFRRALRLNPDLEAVRAQVVRLAKMVEDR